MPDDGKIRLLLVEDEQDLAEVISDTLSEKGFAVRIAHNGAEALEAAAGCKPDIIVTDIMMPVMDGFTFVKKLRTTDKDTPVLFLSARSGAEDVVKGFATGAGDYIRKPFAISELIVRINSLLERKTGNGNAVIYEIGRFTFDPYGRTLHDGNRSVQLPSREADLLKMLCDNQEHFVPLGDILEKLWGSNDYFSTRSLNVHVSRLRKRLSSDPSVSISSLRGRGYMLSVSPGIFPPFLS